MLSLERALRALGGLLLVIVGLGCAGSRASAGGTARIVIADAAHVSVWAERRAVPVARLVFTTPAWNVKSVDASDITTLKCPVQ